MTLSHARTFLFVPGNRPERFAKALASGADAVVLDLEDSVPPDARSAARTAIEQTWPTLQRAPLRPESPPHPILIRINEPTSACGADDLAWLATLPAGGIRPAAILVPKAARPDGLAAVRQALPNTALIPIIESAAGYAALSALAGSEGVCRLALGHIDFMADTGITCDDDENELLPLRFAISMASRLAGLARPIDGVTTALDDPDLITRATHRAVRLGFGGKLCIHPRQIGAVHQAMLPSAEQLDWARRVVAADAQAHGAAVQIDGRMVDVPVVLQARHILALGQQA